MKHVAFIVLMVLFGCRVQTLPTGQVRISFQWSRLLASCITCLSVLFLIQSWSIHTITLDDDASIFAPFIHQKTNKKWKHYITNQPSLSTHHPKFYYPRYCPHTTQSSCAKPVPSFILAGSEYAGTSFMFNILKQHPQVVSAIESHKTLFDMKTEDYDEVNAFEHYMSQFPFLPNTSREDWIVGENAPHYLYASHLTAKRIKDILPHIKLIFLLRDPITRAYAHYLNEPSELSFKTLVDIELPILRRCGHTSTQTGWEGFVRCHQGSEVRASWKVSDTHAFNALAKGMYYPSLVPFLQHFPPSQLFLMRTEDMVQHPQQTFQQLAHFLQLDPHFFDDYPFDTASLLTEAPDLAIQYRLQKVFRGLNGCLVDMYRGFHDWVYDVDRG
ncbi:P-loop containing nucleoside triphosphate hydrolase protein [Gilbertella persicaria]|uniref:P-loop containing nucleoside triphosphate hydrolase protein n=1 Tax=Gilbertella persicaria TaxID=101096 RepID=UPI0022202C27|nr:P-loop containing nucleoside triphosphate hydrolase protein [Gilbertella persicaria]KAI8079493.1 P-loop containing nucleoside triphosphate hydrolase protein [Gilbertella persicaria]